MKALLSKTPGGPESLAMAELANPAAETGEVVIAVKACGVNYPDVLIIRDQYQFKPPRPFAPGGEIADVVETVGEEVQGFASGDRVLAITGWGGMAEKAGVPAKRCVKLPDAISFEDGASFLMTYGTAQHALKDRANLQAGETLLVLGAAGGWGSRRWSSGARLARGSWPPCSTAEKASLARERGAAETVVYGAGAVDGRALAEMLKAACGPGGADVVFDGVGGDYAEPALRTMAWGGRYLVIGFPAGIPRPPLNLVLLKGASVIGVFWGAFVERDPERHAANTAELMALHARGVIRPHISARYPLEQGGEAIRDLAERRATGKVVVIVDPS